MSTGVVKKCPATTQPVAFLDFRNKQGTHWAHSILKGIRHAKRMGEHQGAWSITSRSRGMMYHKRDIYIREITMAMKLTDTCI